MRPAFLPLAFLPALIHAQPPAITQESVRNAASRMPPSLPGGALAPGALFTLDGLRLGGVHSETHIHIKRGSSDLEAQLVSAGAERIEARIPPQAPPGDSQLIVTRDGQPSRPFTIRVLPAAFGIFSRNGKGWGPGEIFRQDSSGEALNTPAAPAQPGSAAVLVGTGLGAASAAEVFVGGKPARVVSLGPRTGRPGVEEIRFQLANDTPPGCYVPVVVKLPESVSNVVTMSVASNGQACPDAMAPTALLVLARLSLHVQLVPGSPVDLFEDLGAAIFPAGERATGLFPPWELLPPTGTCTAYTGRWPADYVAAGAGGDFPPLSPGPGRDAGPRIAVAGPRGTLMLTPSPEAAGIYLAELGGGLRFRVPKPPFLDPGKYRISGQGGRDVGAFATEAVSSSAIEWVGEKGLDTIDRARGAILKWRGVTAGERVIVLAANVDPLTGAAGVCLCLAPGSPGRWRLPALPLSNLPASRDSPGLPISYLLMATLPAETPQTFSAPGLESGLVWVAAARGRMLKYK